MFGDFFGWISKIPGGIINLGENIGDFISKHGPAIIKTGAQTIVPILPYILIRDGGGGGQTVIAQPPPQAAQQPSGASGGQLKTVLPIVVGGIAIFMLARRK